MKDNIITFVIALAIVGVLVAKKFDMIKLDTFEVGVLAGLSCYHIYQQISKW